MILKFSIVAGYQGKVTSALRRAYLGCKTVAHSKCVAKDKAQTAKKCDPVDSRVARRSACLTVILLLNFTDAIDRNRGVELATSNLFHKLDCVLCMFSARYC